MREQEGFKVIFQLLRGWEGSQQHQQEGPTSPHRLGIGIVRQLLHQLAEQFIAKGRDQQPNLGRDAARKHQRRRETAAIGSGKPSYAAPMYNKGLHEPKQRPANQSVCMGDRP